MSSRKSSGLDIDTRLRLTAAEAAAGLRREVSVMRFVRCRSCARGKGCSACTDGLTTREQKLSVKVPAGITAGTKLRLAGKGHESVRDPSGDLFLEVQILADKDKAEKAPPLNAKAPPAAAPIVKEAPKEAVSSKDAAFANTLRKERRTHRLIVAACAAVTLATLGAYAAEHFL